MTSKTGTPPMRILVPIDFSETSVRGLKAAIGLAERMDSELELFHVVDYEPAYQATLAPAAELGEDVVRRARAELEDLARVHLGPDVRCELTVREGHAAATDIARRATETGAGMIVMGTHGRSGLMHLILGSVAEGVIRHAPCPVLAVGPDRVQARAA